MRKSTIEKSPIPVLALYDNNSTEPVKVIIRPGPVEPESLTSPQNLTQLLIDKMISSIEIQKELEFKLAEADNKIKSMEELLTMKDTQVNTFSEGLALMKTKLVNSIPVPHITYIAVTSAAFAFFATSYFIWILKDVLIIDPYYSMCGMIGAITLNGTAVKALKYWRKKISVGS